MDLEIYIFFLDRATERERERGRQQFTSDMASVSVKDISIDIYGNSIVEIRKRLRKKTTTTSMRTTRGRASDRLRAEQ